MTHLSEAFLKFSDIRVTDMYIHALNFNPRKEVSFTNSYVQEEINAVTFRFH